MVEVVTEVTQEFVSKSFLQDGVLDLMDVLIRFVPQSFLQVVDSHQI